jgi:hypothetical protein
MDADVVVQCRVRYKKWLTVMEENGGSGAGVRLKCADARASAVR